MQPAPYALSMSGTAALYPPLILILWPPTGRRAARPRRPPWAPISRPACGRDRCRSSGSLYTSPCPIDCLLRSRSIHTTPRRLSAHSYRVAPADHPVAVPEKYGSAGNERPKTKFLANNFGNGGPMFGPLCRITSNYTADIFTMDLARYSYRWRKFSQVGQTYHWYTWDLYVDIRQQQHFLLFFITSSHAPMGGGMKRPPRSEFKISPKMKQIPTPNLSYLSGQ